MIGIKLCLPSISGSGGQGMRQSKWISCYPAITPSQSSEAGNLLIDNQPGTSQSHNKLTHADAITDITLFNLVFKQTDQCSIAPNYININSSRGIS